MRLLRPTATICIGALGSALSCQFLANDDGIEFVHASGDKIDGGDSSRATGDATTADSTIADSGPGVRDAASVDVPDVGYSLVVISEGSDDFPWMLCTTSPAFESVGTVVSDLSDDTPTVVFLSDGGAYVFVNAGMHILYDGTHGDPCSGAAWAAKWTEVGGQGLAGSAVGAVVTNLNQIDLFVQGAPGPQIWTQHCEVDIDGGLTCGSKWTAISAGLSPGANSSPAAVATDGGFAIFVVDDSGYLEMASWTYDAGAVTFQPVTADGGSWNIFAPSPSAVSCGEACYDVVMSTQPNNLLYRVHIEAGQASHEFVGAITQHSPAIVRLPDGSLSVFYVLDTTPKPALYRTNFVAGAWSGATVVGGYWASGVTAALR